MGNAVSFFGAPYKNDMYILFDAENCVNITLKSRRELM